MPEGDTTIVPGTRLGPYEILDHAGSGGMGDVYRARDTRLNRTVAIKVLPEGFSADADRRERFEREARVIASLSHPHICALHDVGSAPPSVPGEAARSYLVMEYLDGETLAERLTRGPLPTKQVATYGAAIARALDAAHRQHIVHRDLKPGNIMLTRSGLKLLDFGLAKSAQPVSQKGGELSTQAISNATMPGTVVGTFPYMSPEQLQGCPADRRSDIFALGAVLYEMTVGRRAFSGSNAAAISSAILTSEPPPIPSAPALDRIVRTCFEKDPDHRWQSALDVAIQLESFTRRDEEVLRRIDSADARPLEGTDGATSMFWSPDARSLAFFARGKLKRLEVAAGGAPVTICDVREGIGQMGTWGADGRILFASVQGEALLEVPASGGAVTELRKPTGGGPHRLTWPTFLPDGRSYLYQAAYLDDTGVVMFSAPTGEPRRVMEVKSNVHYVAPGYLLFASDGSLVARRFDPLTGTVSGDQIVVSDTVTYFKSTAHFSAGRTGVVRQRPQRSRRRAPRFRRGEPG